MFPPRFQSFIPVLISAEELLSTISPLGFISIKVCEVIAIGVRQIVDTHGVPLLAQQPGHRADTFKGSVSSESVRENAWGPMRLVHLLHKRPSPVAGTRRIVYELTDSTLIY
jgi:hypothetical protein